MKMTYEMETVDNNCLSDSDKNEIREAIEDILQNDLRFGMSINNGIATVNNENGFQKNTLDGMHSFTIWWRDKR